MNFVSFCLLRSRLIVVEHVRVLSAGVVGNVLDAVANVSSTPRLDGLPVDGVVGLNLAGRGRL
jgi:hypothetical protein